MTKRKKIQKKLTFEGKSLEFLHSDADITVLIASRGFGKSIVSSYLTAKKLAMGESGILMAPTYRDCVSILLRNVINILDQQGFVEEECGNRWRNLSYYRESGWKNS